MSGYEREAMLACIAVCIEACIRVCIAGVKHAALSSWPPINGKALLAKGPIFEKPYFVLRSCMRSPGISKLNKSVMSELTLVPLLIYYRTQKSKPKLILISSFDPGTKTSPSGWLGNPIPQNVRGFSGDPRPCRLCA